MRSGEPDGMQVGDLIVTPSLPEYSFLSVFRLVGSYCWDPVNMGAQDRFGHVLPVVLLAEDENLVRELVSSVLSSEGFDVREARNGVEALEVLGRDETLRRMRVAAAQLA
jgi:hypothetical protein